MTVNNAPPSTPNLSDAHRATLAALSRCILNGAPPSGETPNELAVRCDARVRALPPHRLAMLAQALDALGGRTAVFQAIGRLSRFASLSLAQQTRCFASWGESALPALRSAHQAIRQLVMVVHYSHPAVTAAIGYDGPLHLRSPRGDWEGPLPGTPSAHEPVARGRKELPGLIAPDPTPQGVVLAHTIERDVHRSADVVVIGSGAGGAVTAALLAEAGFDVVVLEAGSYLTRSDFNEDEAQLTERLYADGALRSTTDGSVAMLQGATVGGSTVVNWMIMLRTPDYVLHEWARDHGVYGMTPADMAPVFDRVERDVHARLVPDDAHSPNNRLILDGARALGWRASSAKINADQCVRCGFCGQGCRHNAKQSTLITYIPRALRAGATLYADARATRIDVLERETGAPTPPRKRVTAQIGSWRDGRPTRTLTIDAPLVVLAGGAVETPALLQRSALGGGGVGEWLRLHPTTAVTALYDRDIVSSSGISLSTMCDEFIQWENSDYGFWIECPPMQPSFAAAALPSFGLAHAARMRASKQLGVLIALTRDGAERGHSSGRVCVDRAGRTQISYRLSHQDQRRVRASLVAASKIHLAAGSTSIQTMHSEPLTISSERDLLQLDSASLAPNRIALFSAHVNGTCRMGVNPQRSGATPDGERHGVRGLYITDGSLLPTSLGVNPQETIMAVATVLAERMATRHAGLTRA